MSNRKTKINNNSNEEDADNLLSLRMSNDIFLNINNDFKNADEVYDELINKLVEVQNYKGIIKSVFTINKIKCVAIDIGEKQEIGDVIEVDLFNKKFKGIIVKYDAGIVKEIGNFFNYLNDSKFIDMSKSCHFRTIFSETEEKMYKYVKVKDSDPLIYGDCVQIVQINCVDCMEIKKNVFDVNCFVKLSDIEEVNDMSLITQYYKQVIIKPESILKFEAITHEVFKRNDLVRFIDSDDNIFKGILLWTGKLNDKSAGIVSIEDFRTEIIDSYKIDENAMETHFKTKKSGVCVGIFALVRDVVSYMKCNEINLDVVDPKHIYQLTRHSFKEKILIFSVGEKYNIVKLKWKGSIFSQLCIGCELIFESNQGTNGTYGNETLFNCFPNQGVLITADKVKLHDIRNLCELGRHNDLAFIDTKDGYKIYDVNSICCIENLDRIEEKPELKIGCKITYGEIPIGTCIFIGKVNDKLSVGIESSNYVNSNHIVLDVINSYAFQKRKACFIDMQHINIGSFYQTVFSTEISNDSITYYPENNRTKGLPGKVKWYGKHDNGKSVCGIELESEVDENISNYFLEDLFTYVPKHAIIDEEYKIENIVHTETESSGSVQQSENYFNNYEKIINCFLKDEIMEAINELIKHFLDKFIVYVKTNKETIGPEKLSQIINSFYENKKIEQIVDILKSIESINGIFSLLGCLLSKCIEDKELDFINYVLSRLTIFQIDDDTNNQVCLRLAMKCLENMKEENKPEYHELKKIYESFIGLCGNPRYIFDEETFMMKMISNDSISEKILIEEMKSGKFDINQSNSNDNSPMKLAIDKGRKNILAALFDLDCNIDKLNSIQSELIDDLKTVNAPEKVEIIKLINKHLEKKIPTTSSMSCNKETEDSKG